MIWEDGSRIMGEEGTNFTGDTIIPDDGMGSGSSIPGGPGVLSTAARTATSASGNSRSSSDGRSSPSSGSCSDSASNGKSSRGRRQKGRQANDTGKQALVDDTKALLKKMSDAAELEIKNIQAEAADKNEKLVRDLAERVDEYHTKVATAKTERSRQTFEMLLEDAQTDLDKAIDARRRDRAAAELASEEDTCTLVSMPVTTRRVSAGRVATSFSAADQGGAAGAAGAGAGGGAGATQPRQAELGLTPVEALPGVARAVAETDV